MIHANTQTALISFFCIGNFLFIESTSRQQGDLARVASPIYPGSSGKCQVRFFYHMNGLTMGTLKVSLDYYMEIGMM